MALGVGTTDKILGKVADKVGVLSDTVKGSNKQLKGAIEYNTELARKADENRIDLAEQTFANAQKTLKEFNESKVANQNSQNVLKNLLKRDNISSEMRKKYEDKMTALQEEQKKLQEDTLNQESSFDEAVATIADVRTKGEKGEDALVLEGIDKQIEI